MTEKALRIERKTRLPFGIVHLLATLPDEEKAEQSFPCSTERVGFRTFMYDPGKKEKGGLALFRLFQTR